MSLRTIIGGIGAVVGGIIGGPFGAQLGWAIGGLVGGAIDPQVIKGPAIGDIAVQTSSEGGPIPIVFGTSPPLAGNVLADGGPIIVKNKKSAGKGGPKYETESVFRTYAVGICEGPIVGVKRVWRNSKLVYDISDDPIVSIEDNAAFLEYARFFLGTYDQDPSPDLEAIFGVGETAAHRGIAYMVLADENLTDTGGAWAQWMFQVDNTTPEVVMVELRSNGGAGYAADDNPIPLALPDDIGPNGALFIYISHGSTGDVDPPQTSTVTYGGNPLTEIANLMCAAGGGVFNAPSRARNQNFALALGGATFDNNLLTFTASYGNYYPTFSYYFFANVKQEDIYTPFDSDTDVVAPTTAEPLLSDELTCASETYGLVMLASSGSGRAYMLTTFYPIPVPVQVPAGITPVPDPAGGSISGPWPERAYENFSSLFTWYGESVVDSDGEFYVVNNKASSNPDAYGEHSLSVKAMSFRCSVEAIPGAQQISSLRGVVRNVCARAGIDSDGIDVSLLPNIQIGGLVITNQYPATEALRSLGQVYMFDVASYGGVLHCIPRGANSAATITEDDMLTDDGTIDQSTREDQIIIPRVMHINYYDIDNGGLNSGKQTSERAGDRRSVGERSLQTPVVMTADLAAKTIDIQHKIMIEESKGELKFSLPDSYIGLVPSDAIIVQWEGHTERVRVAQIEIFEGYQALTCLRDRQSAYTSEVEGIPLPPPTSPPSSIPGPTLLRVFDIHILRDADDNIGLSYYVAVAGTTAAWSGALVELSYDGGVSYTEADTITVSTVMGRVETTLNDHPADFVDDTNTCVVSLQTFEAELESTDLTGMLDGFNLAIIEDELINFGNADQDSAGNWVLSNFLRGRKGTAPEQHDFNAPFTVLNRSALGFVPASLTDIGRTLTFRATSVGAATITGTVVSIVYEGRSQIEREPAYLSVYRDGDDLHASWLGVGRLGAGTAVAQGSRFTGFRVTFDDGSAPPIVVDTTSEAIVQDVSTLSSPVTVSVVQMNSLTGAGPSIEVIIV